MNVTISPQVEKALIALATERGLDPNVLGGSLIEASLRENGYLNGAMSEVHEDADAIHPDVAAMMNRTPEQIRAAQEWAIREFPPERELPPGKTLWDVIQEFREKIADLEDDPGYLEREVAKMINRTPEQIKAAQEKAIRELKPLTGLDRP